ncbi:carbohydrate-binding module family 50 protein [Stipitochalara longipes BDJ]|nr:carbohydrate-binding module family 50 protein [Stipitochalara longipes BDJ]
MLSLVGADLVLYPWMGNDGSFGNPVDAVVGFGNSTPVSASCASALNQTLACDPQLQILAATGYYASFNGSFSSLCTSQCNASLVAYHSSVVSACGTSGAFSTYPNAWRGDYIYDYFNLVCTKDVSTGEFCPQWLQQEYSTNGNPSMLDLPDSVLCSSCQLGYLRTVQSSAFWGYNTAMVPLYTQIFDRTLNLTTNATCGSGNLYAAKIGDTCHSIALAHSVSESSISVINNLHPDCSLLSTRLSQNPPPPPICLPPTCATYVTANDTCWTISSAKGITYPQFLAWNPAISPDCSNLNATGSVVCISNPDGPYTPIVLQGANSSTTGVYADNVVAPPGLTAAGTTSNCGEYYLVQIADTCSRISIAAGIPVELFEATNPSIDAGCDNLVPDIWYCIHPTLNCASTSATSSSITAPLTTQAPPAPTPPGTTGSCYSWHVVVSGDTCSQIEQTFGISMAQLVLWNPNLSSTCNNLLLGEAYCVDAPTSTTTSTTLTTQAPPGPTPPGTTSSCFEWHLVVSGDTCSQIEQTFGITIAQLATWNPNLSSTCSNLLLGEAYCVDGPAS